MVLDGRPDALPGMRLYSAQLHQEPNAGQGAKGIAKNAANATAADSMERWVAVYF